MIRFRVREVAEAKGVSQTWLSHKAYVDPERLRRIWRDGTSESANITMIVLDRLAKALQVDASQLIESVPDPEIVRE